MKFNLVNDSPAQYKIEYKSEFYQHGLLKLSIIPSLEKINFPSEINQQTQLKIRDEVFPLLRESVKKDQNASLMLFGLNQCAIQVGKYSAFSLNQPCTNNTLIKLYEKLDLYNYVFTRFNFSRYISERLYFNCLNFAMQNFNPKMQTPESLPNVSERTLPANFQLSDDTLEEYKSQIIGELNDLYRSGWIIIPMDSNLLLDKLKYGFKVIAYLFDTCNNSFHFARMICYNGRIAWLQKYNDDLPSIVIDEYGNSISNITRLNKNKNSLFNNIYIFIK